MGVMVPGLTDVVSERHREGAVPAVDCPRAWAVGALTILTKPGWESVVAAGTSCRGGSVCGERVSAYATAVFEEARPADGDGADDIDALAGRPVPRGCGGAGWTLGARRDRLGAVPAGAMLEESKGHSRRFKWLTLEDVGESDFASGAHPEVSSNAFPSELFVPERCLTAVAGASVVSGLVPRFVEGGICGWWVPWDCGVRIVDVIAIRVVEARDPPFASFPADRGLCTDAVREGAVFTCSGVGVAVALPFAADRREVLVVRAAV